MRILFFQGTIVSTDVSSYQAPFIDLMASFICGVTHSWLCSLLVHMSTVHTWICSKQPFVTIVACLALKISHCWIFRFCLHFWDPNQTDFSAEAHSQICWFLMQQGGFPTSAAPWHEHDPHRQQHNSNADIQSCSSGSWLWTFQDMLRLFLMFNGNLWFMMMWAFVNEEEFGFACLAYLMQHPRSLHKVFSRNT